MKYNALISDHFRSPRNVGELPGANAVGAAVNEVCLDKLKLYLQIVDGAVFAASYQAEGCVPSLAVGSFLTEFAIGKTREELHALEPDALEKLLGGLPATKKHAAFLAVDALRDALRDFQTR